MSTPQTAVAFSPLSLALVGLRAAALALNLTGKGKAGQTLYALADAAEAGQNVDAHMATVAEKLKSRSVQDSDWEEVANAIAADSDRLQAG